MIVPFIFEMSTISNGLLEPHYYAEAVNMVKDKNAPMIIQEKYNLLPSENKDIELFDTNNPTVKAYFNYTSFTDEDVKKVERYIIPQTFEDYIIEEKGGINNAFISLIKERNTELEKILEEIILKIIEKYGKIDGFHTLIEIKSLTYLAEKYGAKMIFFEQGVFRAGTYLNTAMMSFCSLITKEGMLHLENRFSQFCNEIERLSDSERKDFKILTKKQILSIFLMPNYLHYLDNFQTPDEYNKPGNSSVIYEIGCATGATFDIRYLHETLYSDSELIYTTMQNYDLKDIIVRRHPGDPTQSNFLQYSTKKAYDDSHNATEFILKCKRIASTGSNVSIEAAFWGRTPYVLTSCGAYNKTLHNLKIKEEQLVDDLYLNWYAFSFLFPREFYFDYDYMTYRLSNPPEIELYNKNLDYYLKQSRIRRSLLEIEPEESVKKIRELRALTVME